MKVEYGVQMKKTEYLFGQPPARYPEIVPLAKRRIADGKLLLKRLADRKNELDSFSDEMDHMIKRYQATAKAIDLWQGLLDEHNGEQDE